MKSEVIINCGLRTLCVFKWQDNILTKSGANSSHRQLEEVTPLIRHQKTNHKWCISSGASDGHFKVFGNRLEPIMLA